MLVIQQLEAEVEERVKARMDELLPRLLKRLFRKENTKRRNDSARHNTVNFLSKEMIEQRTKYLRAKPIFRTFAD